MGGCLGIGNGLDTAGLALALRCPGSVGTNGEGPGDVEPMTRKIAGQGINVAWYGHSDEVALSSKVTPACSALAPRLPLPPRRPAGRCDCVNAWY